MSISVGQTPHTDRGDQQYIISQPHDLFPTISREQWFGRNIRHSILSATESRDSLDTQSIW
uniref:Uncharacterized protein n=1 Tax=viral metagenome TaxID=1070528 RepID=A0A6C0BKQ8_9ZZZZ